MHERCYRVLYHRFGDTQVARLGFSDTQSKAKTFRSLPVYYIVIVTG